VVVGADGVQQPAKIIVGLEVSAMSRRWWPASR
jgi:hypothetical protein